jgi:hypothetical protein
LRASVGSTEVAKLLRFGGPKRPKCAFDRASVNNVGTLAVVTFVTPATVVQQFNGVNGSGTVVTGSFRLYRPPPSGNDSYSRRTQQIHSLDLGDGAGRRLATR